MQWLFNRNSKKEYYRMGFYSDQNGIMRRYRRESKFWNIHNTNTQKAILKFVEHKPKNKVAILGSGWLLDVPIEELTSLFDEVWLFDIYHPKPILHKYKKHNVIFSFTDISCFALPVFDLCHKTKNISYNELIALPAAQNLDLSAFDCVISCNILDQLDELLIEFIRKKCKLAPETEAQFRTKIQNHHISLLPKGKSIIICDQNEVWVNSQNEIIDRKNLLLTNKNELTYIADWTWKFDNTFMYNDNYKTWFEVYVYKL